MTRSASQGRVLRPAQNAQQLSRPLPSTSFIISAPIKLPSTCLKNFAAPSHAPLLHIHYSTQSPKNSRCEFSTMHRNRVATGTRQQDLSPFCSLPSQHHRATIHRPLRPRPSLSSPRMNGATLAVAFSLTTSAVRLWSGLAGAFSARFYSDVAREITAHSD